MDAHGIPPRILYPEPLLPERQKDAEPRLSEREHHSKRDAVPEPQRALLCRRRRADH